MDQGDFLVAFCEGNPGCAGVVGKIYQHGHMPAVVLTTLVSMNIRGAQLYVAFTGVCSGNIVQLVDRILKRDPTLVDNLNDIMYRPGRVDLPARYYQELAVVDGWKPVA